MLPVEIIPFQGTLIIRARGSELLILPQHVKQLKGLKQPKDFTEYFLRSALVNRPARKLFEAWLRKDQGLWKRVYTTIQKDMPDEAPEAEAATPAAEVKKEPAKAPLAGKTVTAPVAEETVEAKPAAKKNTKKEAEAVSEPKAEKKKVATTAKKAAEEPVKKATKKATATKAPAKKASASKAPAKKTAAKKTSSKSK